jgi:hypothetical protein
MTDHKTTITAALQHDVSKAYAEKATSRLLKAEHNEVLLRAAASEEVDVVLFRKAATAALSLAATRAGQSMARRDWTREARHLIYWADAIIDQHVEGLPVYEKGARSPRIAELEREVEHAGVVNQSLTSDLTTLKQAASDERRRLCAEIDAGKAAYAKVVEAANGEIDKFQERHNQDHKELQGLYLEINEAHAALEYAFGLLNDEQQSRLAGFRDGYAARVNEQ